MQEGRDREYSDNVRASVVSGTLASSAADQHCSSNTSGAAANLPIQAVDCGRLCIAPYRMRSNRHSESSTASDSVSIVLQTVLSITRQECQHQASTAIHHMMLCLIVCHIIPHFLQVVLNSWVLNSGRAVVILSNLKRQLVILIHCIVSMVGAEPIAILLEGYAKEGHSSVTHWRLR